MHVRDPRAVLKVAGANDAFSGYDGGWAVSTPYLVTLEPGDRQITYRIASRTRSDPPCTTHASREDCLAVGQVGGGSQRRGRPAPVDQQQAQVVAEVAAHMLVDQRDQVAQRPVHRDRAPQGRR